MKYENKAKNGYFNTILTAICSFVGVGFITGAEIWFYFARFGKTAIFGTIIFGIMTYVLLSLSISDKKTNNPKVLKLKTRILIVGEMAVASAMVSGLFETTRIIFNKCWLIVFLISIFVLITLFVFEKKSYLFYNYILMIVIIFVIVLLFLYNNNINDEILIKNQQNFSIKNLLFSTVFACVYIFSNISELRPVLEDNTKNYSKKQKKILCILLSLCLIILAFMLEIQFFRNIGLSKFSMPFLIVFKRKGGLGLWVFLAGLVMTMISTACACLIGVKNKINFNKNDENFIKIIVIIISLICGQIPFKIFIKIIYPIVAIFNFLVFLIEIFEHKKFLKIQK